MIPKSFKEECLETKKIPVIELIKLQDWADVFTHNILSSYEHPVPSLYTEFVYQEIVGSTLQEQGFDVHYNKGLYYDSGSSRMKRAHPDILAIKENVYWLIECKSIPRRTIDFKHYLRRAIWQLAEYTAALQWVGTHPEVTSKRRSFHVGEKPSIVRAVAMPMSFDVVSEKHIWTHLKDIESVLDELKEGGIFWL